MVRRSGPPVVTVPPSDRINPGVSRTRNVLDPLRRSHIEKGSFRPSNQWRHKTGGDTHTDVRQRALLLAKRLPWLPQYNFARG